MWYLLSFYRYSYTAAFHGGFFFSTATLKFYRCFLAVSFILFHGGTRALTVDNNNDTSGENEDISSALFTEDDCQRTDRFKTQGANYWSSDLWWNIKLHSRLKEMHYRISMLNDKTGCALSVEYILLFRILERTLRLSNVYMLMNLSGFLYPCSTTLNGKVHHRWYLKKTNTPGGFKMTSSPLQHVTR